MTDLSDPNTLPLAKSSQPLNRILGAQTDENGVASYALFPLHVLDQGSGVITKISVSQEDITAGQTSNGTLYVQSQDGQVHTSTISFPAGAKGDKGDTGPQGPAGPPGESGDFATSLQLSNEIKIRADTDNNLNATITDLQNSKINRSGDTLTGTLYSTGTFNPSENVYATQPIGAALKGEEFYLQLVNDNNNGYTSGRFVLRDGGGNYHIPIQIDNYNKTSINGSLNITGDTIFQNSVFSQGTFQQGNLELTQPIGAGFWKMQFFLQLANDAQNSTTYGRLVLCDNGGNYRTILNADTKGNITTERNTHFLEGTDTGNGHVTIDNIGSASGKTLATLDDLTDKVNRSGDTMYGDLTISGSSEWEETQFGGKYISIVEGEKSNSYFQTQINGDSTNAVIGVQDNNGAWHNWNFNPFDGSIITPTGRTVATTDEITAEIQRAEKIEATLLPRSGGTMSGNLSIQLTNTWSFGRGGGETTQAMADGPERFYQQIYRSNGGITQGILGVADETGDRQWKLQANGTIATPAGNTLLETNGPATKIQTFTAFARFDQSNPARILFPVAFAPGTVPTVILTPSTEVIGYNEVWCTYGIAKRGTDQALDVDNTGFTCTSYAQGLNGPSHGANLIPVTAIGVMS